MFEALLSNRTVSVLMEALPRILTAGLTMTIPLTLLSFFFAMIIAVAVALVQYANVPVLRQIARFYIWVIRGTPLLVQLFIIFYGLPSVGIMLNAFPAAVIAFAFNEGAYCAETMRGALESVPQGQLEAGYCVGMSWWQIMRRIVLPQALRTAVPALSNSLIGMIKDTSLASNITVAELFMAGQRVAARTYIFLPIYCEVAVVYLLFCTVTPSILLICVCRCSSTRFSSASSIRGAGAAAVMIFFAIISISLVYLSNCTSPCTRRYLPFLILSLSSASKTLFFTKNFTVVESLKSVISKETIYFSPRISLGSML